MTMRVHFTKMQGAGNDFVVLDETRGLLGLKRDDYRLLADRHFGVGADQILSVRPSPVTGADFEYVIHNADGGEVEQCGNGARCFARYVAERGLSPKTTLRVLTRAGIIEPCLQPDGRVTVDMGAPVLEPTAIPFNASGLQPLACGNAQQWPIDLPDDPAEALCIVISMGNPHAVLLVDDVDAAPVQRIGQALQQHPRFPARVNAGFMQVLSRRHIRLRVFERGVGETLACGTGACAATVAGILAEWLDSPVDVDTRGGTLSCEWAAPRAHVLMTGPAHTVFEGTIDLPDRI